MTPETEETNEFPIPESYEHNDTSWGVDRAHSVLYAEDENLCGEVHDYFKDTELLTEMKEPENELYTQRMKMMEIEKENSFEIEVGSVSDRVLELKQVPREHRTCALNHDIPQTPPLNISLCAYNLSNESKDTVVDSGLLLNHLLNGETSRKKMDKSDPR